MDDLSHRLVNRVLGNAERRRGARADRRGPDAACSTRRRGRRARRRGDADDGRRRGRSPPWTPVAGRRRRDRSRSAPSTGPGLRATLGVRGGIDVPPYLGSRSTFTLGRFGGHDGPAARGRRRAAGRRRRRPADAGAAAAGPGAGARPTTGRSACSSARTPRPSSSPTDGLDALPAHRVGGALQLGAHRRAPRRPAAPVGPRRRRRGRPAPVEHPRHRLRDRRGRPHRRHAGHPRPRRPEPRRVRLPGGGRRGRALEARPARARATASASCRWSPARGRAADRRRADVARAGRSTAIEPLARPVVEHGRPAPAIASSDAVLAASRPTDDAPAVTFRQAGDRFLLVEFGDMTLDLELRLRVHALDRWVRRAPRRRRRRRDRRACGRCSSRSTATDLDGATARCDARARGRRTSSTTSSTEPFPSRIVHLPLSWDDPATREAIERYMHGVRADAPWCPWNIEFIRRINGLDSVDDVHRIVFDASYLVLGLGDVYLGAPVATPLDPRHRLVTTKYNPARTWTAENSVGIGGAYLCIYGMEGPGGYQFVGRTVQVWNRDRLGPHFTEPWLLRTVRPAPLVPGRRRRAARPARRSRRGDAARSEIEDDDVPPRRPPSGSSPSTPTRSTTFRRTPAAPRSTTSAARGPTPGSSTTGAACVDRPSRGGVGDVAVARTAPPSTAAVAALDAIAADGRAGIWIELVDRDDGAARRPPTSTRASRPARRCRWPGSTFAVKDNIDVAGLRTTAGCPTFGDESPTAARRRSRALVDAGAVVDRRRRTSTSSPPASSAPARPTASARTPTGPA